MFTCTHPFSEEEFAAYQRHPETFFGVLRKQWKTDGNPLKLAVDTDAVLGTNAAGNRVRYATNTDHGSSGSPVFDIDWKLVALHHLGDPAVSSMPAKYNQGIPIAKIRARLERDGKAGALGAE